MLNCGFQINQWDMIMKIKPLLQVMILKETRMRGGQPWAAAHRRLRAAAATAAGVGGCGCAWLGTLLTLYARFGLNKRAASAKLLQEPAALPPGRQGRPGEADAQLQTELADEPGHQPGPSLGRPITVHGIHGLDPNLGQSKTAPASLG